MTCMRTLRFALVLSFLFPLVAGGFLLGQVGFGRKLPPGTAKHVIFGDLTVEGADQFGAPQGYIVMLKNAAGVVFGRDSVAAGGRFRFLNVPNAEYDLLVEVNNEVVYRSRFLLNESRGTDLQKNIELVWENAQAVYARSGENLVAYEKAQEMVSRGDLKQAAALFEKITESDPQDFEAWTELGTVQFRRKKPEEAAGAYLEATRAKPDYLLAWLNLGKAQLDQKQDEQAIESLTQAVQLDPKNAECNQMLGEAYLRIKKGSKAVGFLYEAIRLDPAGKAEVHLRLAQLYKAAKLMKRAAKEYQDFLDKKPDWPHRQELEEYIEKYKGP